MGFYINPPGTTKEAFLSEHGKMVSHQDIAKLSSVNYIDGATLPVCLVQNGQFTAAAIVYGPSEFRAFNDPEDGRHKKWYMVPKSKLTEEQGAKEIPKGLLGK